MRTCLLPWVVGLLSEGVLLLGCGASTEERAAPTVVDVRPTPDAGAIATTPSPPQTRTSSPAQPRDEAAAKRSFVAGRQAFDRGDYEGAAALFRSAYEVARRPELLYDLGRALELAGRRRDAADTYEEYVKLGDLSHTDRMSMELRIQNLRATP